MPQLDPDTVLPEALTQVAVRAACEGIPVAAIARICHEPAERVYGTLKLALSLGSIAELPKPDWPPTARLADRLPTIPRTLSDDDLSFTCRKAFGLTNLEAAFLVLLLKHDHADKAKLHHVVETQRMQRANQPDKTELTDPKMVDVMICKLRKKLVKKNDALIITTIWGGGYYLEPAVKAICFQIIGYDPNDKEVHAQTRADAEAAPAE